MVGSYDREPTVRPVPVEPPTGHLALVTDTGWQTLFLEGVDVLTDKCDDEIARLRAAKAGR